MKPAKITEVNTALAAGSIVLFTWATCHLELVNTDGSTRAIDGRSYDSIRHNPSLTKLERGSTEDKTLTIMWMRSR